MDTLRQQADDFRAKNASLENSLASLQSDLERKDEEIAVERASTERATEGQAAAKKACEAVEAVQSSKVEGAIEEEVASARAAIVKEKENADSASGRADATEKVLDDIRTRLEQSKMEAEAVQQLRRFAQRQRRPVERATVEGLEAENARLRESVSQLASHCKRAARRSRQQLPRKS